MPAARVPLPLLTHDDDVPHFHELSEEERAAVAETSKTENVIDHGRIDIGSSTST
jgi:hypothetical protein